MRLSGLMGGVEPVDDKKVPTGAVVTQPSTVDPNWREKIETAKRARSAATTMRKGKPSSFRGAVGRRVS